MSKKRSSLEDLLHDEVNVIIEDNNKEKSDKKRPHVKQQTVYLPIEVYEQLRTLAFEERKKMHSYLLEGLDLIFKSRGLASIQELKKKK